MVGTFKDHFSTHAAGYAASRPGYPQALVDYLADLAPANLLALDCACGSGQLTILLADRFHRVIGTDASSSQIGHARAHHKVEYRVAPAEISGLAPKSANLVTVAQAAHWLDLEPFYAEVRRIACPGAPLALISYGILEIDGDLGAILRDFYYETLEDYGPPERRHVANGYRSLSFPFDEIEAPAFSIHVTWSFAQLMDFIETKSVVRQMEKRCDRARLDRLRADLEAAWKVPHQLRACRWPISMRLGIL